MSDTAMTTKSHACLEQLQLTLAALAGGDSPELLTIQQDGTLMNFDTGHDLLEAGDIAKHVYFIYEGLVRFYYLTADGKEHNKSFSAEGQFAGAIQSSTHPESSRFFIRALESVSAISIATTALEHRYGQSIVWANIGPKYMESVAVRKERREGEFLLDSAEKRYQRFIAEQPKLAARLPLYNPPSYLGITDVALSRIRRRLKESGAPNSG